MRMWCCFPVIIFRDYQLVRLIIRMEGSVQVGRMDGRTARSSRRCRRSEKLAQQAERQKNDAVMLVPLVLVAIFLFPSVCVFLFASHFLCRFCCFCHPHRFAGMHYREEQASGAHATTSSSSSSSSSSRPVLFVTTSSTVEAFVPRGRKPPVRG